MPSSSGPLACDVEIEGDVRALALAEGAFGAARGVQSYASMVVSTGVGGALVMDGRLVNGDSGNAGHLGHFNVVPDGRRCSCGSTGCLEAEASGWAITEMTGRRPSSPTTTVRTRTATLVGRAIGTLASVLDFNHCYVAGSVALGFGDEFFATANTSARELATIALLHDLVVRRSWSRCRRTDSGRRVCGVAGVVVRRYWVRWTRAVPCSRTP